MIQRGIELAAVALLFLVGVIAYAMLGGGPQIEDSPPFWAIFLGLALLAFPIGYVMERFFFLAGPAPCTGMIVALFIDSGAGNLWPIAILFWAAALLATLGLSWAGRALRLYRHRATPGLCPKCGYGLRGHADDAERRATGSVICPECGWNRSAGE